MKQENRELLHPTNQQKKQQRQEYLLILLVIVVALLSATAVFLMVGTSGITLSSLPTAGQIHYSHPVEVLTQSAPGEDGRHAYVKMSFIAAFEQRRDLTEFSQQMVQVKSILTQALNHYPPETLLQSDELDHLQEEVRQELEAQLNIHPSAVYLDRITVQ